MATAYHRLAREHPDHAWWKLPVAGVTGVVVYFGVLMVLFVAAMAIAAIAGRDAFEGFMRWTEEADTVSASDPALLAFELIGLAVLIPCVLLPVLMTGPRPAGYISSVAGRLRWRWLAWSALAAAVVYGVSIGGLVLLSDDSVAPSIDGPRTIVLLVVVLLLVPLQAAGEEYVFRGYLMQLVGSWTRFAIVPIVVSTPLFALGHSYGLWGLVDVGVFGLTAAVLVIRTGGLEAAIAAHAANNIALFALEAVGSISTDDTGGGPLDVLPTVGTSLVFLGVIEVMVRRLGIVRTREPLPPKPPKPAYAPPAWQGWQPPPYPQQGHPQQAYAQQPQWSPAPPAHAQQTWGQQPWPQQSWSPPQPPAWRPPRIADGTPEYPGEIAEDWGEPVRTESGR